MVIIFLPLHIYFYLVLIQFFYINILDEAVKNIL